MQGLLETLGVAYAAAGGLRSALSVATVTPPPVTNRIRTPTPAFDIIDAHWDMAAVIVRLIATFAKPMSERDTVDKSP